MKVERLERTDVMFRYWQTTSAVRHQLQVTVALNTFFSKRKGGISHAHNCTSPNDRKRIDYILSRQAHRPKST